MISRLAQLRHLSLLQGKRLPGGTNLRIHIPVRTFASLSTQKTNEASSDELHLTKEEALSYLENVLEIPTPIALMRKNKFDFLCEVQRKTKLIQPFSTLIFIMSGNQIPTQEQTKEIMFQRQGGGCLQINTFTRAVLEHLGYQAYIVGATLSKERTKVYEAHFGLIVQNVTKKGSLHLVEPGTVHPIIDPVPLDFTRVSPEYQLESYPIRFFRECPGIVKLCMPIMRHTESLNDANIYNERGKMWRTMITYRVLQAQNWKNGTRAAETLLRDSSLIPVAHKEIVIFGYVEGLWTVIKGKTFVQYDKDRKEKFKRLETNEEVVENAHRCFPQYSRDELWLAIQYTEQESKLLDKIK